MWPLRFRGGLSYRALLSQLNVRVQYGLRCVTGTFFSRGTWLSIARLFINVGLLGRDLAIGVVQGSYQGPRAHVRLDRALYLFL